MCNFISFAMRTLLVVLPGSFDGKAGAIEAVNSCQADFINFMLVLIPVHNTRERLDEDLVDMVSCTCRPA